MTMIRSVVEYALPVWSPSTEHNISKLEMVQRRAARFVMNDFSRYSSVSRMISQLYRMANAQATKRRSQSHYDVQDS